MPRKKGVKKIGKKAEEKFDEAIKNEPSEAVSASNDGIYELINGYAVVANGEYLEVCGGDKGLLFGEAVKLYKLKKSI